MGGRDPDAVPCAQKMQATQQVMIRGSLLVLDLRISTTAAEKDVLVLPPGGDLLQGRPLFSKGLALVLLAAFLVVVCGQWRSAVPLGAVFKLVFLGVAH